MRCIESGSAHCKKWPLPLIFIPLDGKTGLGYLIKSRALAGFCEKLI
jgi:hypothetical protein